MFRAVPMMGLRVVVLERDEREVLRDLGQLGAIQLTVVPCGPETAPLPPRDRTDETARCGVIKTRLDALCRSLDVQLKGKEPAHAEASLHEAEGLLSAMEKKAATPLERRAQLVERQRELTELCENLSSFRGVDMPLDHDSRFSYLHFVTGSLPAQNIDNLRASFGEAAVLFPLGQSKGRQTLVAVTHTQGRTALEDALKREGFQREPLRTGSSGTVDTLHDEAEREQAGLISELKEVSNEIDAMKAEFTPALRGIQALVDLECRLIEAGQKLLRTKATVLVTGWIPAESASVVEEHVARITGGSYALKTRVPDGSEGDSIPVLFRHSWLLRPFVTVVATYGLPGYKELEPTLFVALSYVLMFGIMFGDAGHGLILALCGLAVLLRAPKKIKDFGLLVLFAGLSSIFFGLVYGSVFGIEFFKKYALWNDPLEGNPIKLMYFTMGFGIVMISIGLIINVINRFLRGDVIGGFLDKFGVAGILFYWGALALLTNTHFFSSQGLVELSVAIFLVLPILAWVSKEPLEHILARRSGAHHTGHGGMVDAITESFVGAFEAVLGYLANTISFVRLAAYAMSHAALLVAAFMLAEQVKGMPIGGGVLGVIVVILGNLVAIVLEGIIASVQALRLEYYEFFGKFLSGSGQPFEPFRLAEGNEP